MQDKQIIIDNRKLSKKMDDAIATYGKEFEPFFVSNVTLGYFYNSFEQRDKYIAKHNSGKTTPMRQKYESIPHPYLSIDHLDSLMRVQLYFGEAFPLFTKAILSKKFNMTEIEALISFIAYDTEDDLFRDFKHSIAQFGVYGFLCTLLPFIHYTNQSKTYTFSDDFHDRVCAYNISSQIMTRNIKVKDNHAYYHIGTNHDLTIHNSESGYHKLCGFYVDTVDDHTFILDPNALSLFKISNDKPYRVFTITFIGESKEYLGNDCVFKMDIFFQDDQTVEEMIDANIQYHLGDIDTDLTEFIKKGLIAVDASSPLFPKSDGNKIIEKGKLLTTVINYITYLSFGEYDSEVLNNRTFIKNIIQKKKPKQQAKEASRLKDVTDTIHLSLKPEH